MDITLLLIVSVPGLLLLVLGYLIRFRKMYFLISGYNTMSAEKKKNVNTEGLSILMGNSLFVMGGVMFAGMTLMVVRQSTAGFAVLSLMLPLIIYILIAAQKYDGNTRSESGQMKTGSKIAVAAIIVGIILLVGGIAYSLNFNSKPVEVLANAQSIQIKGAYGFTIERAMIKSVTLQDSLPSIQMRTNGLAVGSHLKGNFKMESLGSVKLFIDRNIPPFIVIETTDRPVILNQSTAADTKALYEIIIKS
jgi:hypothetical protein